MEDGRLRGTITNASTRRLESVAVVLGQTVAVLRDLEPGAGASVDVVLQAGGFNQFGGNGQSLSDKVVGQNFFSDPSASADAARTFVRRTMLDQLTFDPTNRTTNLLSADGPVVLGWGSSELLPVEIDGQTPKRLGNVLYYLPARLTIHGLTTFPSDLIRSTVIEGDAGMLQVNPKMGGFGRGTATVAYRPIGFEGRIAATELTIALNSGDFGGPVPPQKIVPIGTPPAECSNAPADSCAVATDGLPEIEVFDISAQTWKRLPHLGPPTRYSVADPARYVDPASGSVLVRFINDSAGGVGFGVDVSITGTIE
jgi:hypothetical protein